MHPTWSNVGHALIEGNVGVLIELQIVGKLELSIKLKQSWQVAMQQAL